MKTLPITILPEIKRGDWRFKTSVNEIDGIICIVAFNPIFQYAVVKYFDSENLAFDWVEYLIIQSSNLKEMK